MGHERIGHLPKTETWQAIIRKLETLYSTDEDIARIAGLTSRNVSRRYKRIADDKGVQATFTFLVLVAAACRDDTPHSKLAEWNIDLRDNTNLFELAKALNTYVVDRHESFEYSTLARASAMDALTDWYTLNRSEQRHLFQKTESFLDSWDKIGSGAGFCELARLFFANLTERYLRYFLEREASTALPTIDDRERFGRELSEHISSVSKHAFETAKITQSFAAGWFNKTIKLGGTPSDESTRGFLHLAFNKMREELERGKS